MYIDVVSISILILIGIGLSWGVKYFQFRSGVSYKDPTQIEVYNLTAYGLQYQNGSNGFPKNPSIIQVIRAAYKALASIYHPDKNSDPEASTRMKDINEAWSVISDPLTRANQDTQRNSKTADDTLFEEEESEFSQEELEEDWKFAKSFYPEIETNESRLKRINWRLAFAYKAFLLESKGYTDADLICSNFENEFLSTYFGKSEKLIDLAKELIFKYKFHDLLKDLNKTVRVLGEGSDQIILDRFNEKIKQKIGRTIEKNSAFAILRKEGYSVEKVINEL